jgi:hypothetical protein
MQMTDQEREIVLKMIEDGKISPEDGLKLMQALKPLAEDAIQAAVATPGPDEPSGAPRVSVGSAGLEYDPNIEKVKNTARRLWQIPLWIGVAVTILTALGMYFIQSGAGLNFWFFCLGMPLLLGIALIVAGVGSRHSRWIFVDVKQKPGEKPGRISLGFPLPLKFTAWFLRTFGHKIPNLKKTNVDEIIQVVQTGLSGDDPLVVDVDEGEEGERVKVYIG